jgi:hypothetical protein
VKLIGYRRDLGLLTIEAACSEQELDQLVALVRHKIAELPGPDDPGTADDSNVREWMAELAAAKAERDDAKGRQLGAASRLATAGSGTPGAAVALMNTRDAAGQDFARSQARVAELERLLGQARQALGEQQRALAEKAEAAYRETLRERLLPLHEQLADVLLRGALPSAVALLIALGRLGPPS